MFRNNSVMESANFFFEIKECKVFCVKIFFKLVYWQVSIYLKYYKPHSLLKIVKKWLKVNVSKNVCDGEHPFFSKWRRDIKSLMQKY